MKKPTDKEYTKQLGRIEKHTLYDTNVGVACSTHCKPAYCKSTPDKTDTTQKISIRDIRK